MNELSKIDYPVTKAAQASWADGIKRALTDGEVNPVEFIAKLRGLRSALDIVDKDKDVRDIVIREISKHGKSATWNGATLTVKDTGARYDYTACGDPVYDDLARKLKELEDRIKEREAFLKAVQPGTTLVMKDTGEVVTLYPPVHMATESYSVTFK